MYNIDNVNTENNNTNYYGVLSDDITCIDDMLDVYRQEFDFSEDVHNQIKKGWDRRVTLSSKVSAHGHEFGARCILLDTCAGTPVFNSSNLFRSIETTDDPIIVDGCNKLGESVLVNQSGMTDFGEVHYDENCVGNILSYGYAVDNYSRVRYVHEDDEFLVQVSHNGDTYMFARDIETNIYICDLDTMVCDSAYMGAKHSMSFVTTVKGQMSKYNKREVKSAELAREIGRKMGFSAPSQLIKMINNGKFINNKLVSQDVLRAVDIWGVDLGTLKGKTPSHKSELATELDILVKTQSEDQIMHTDIMYVNGTPYFISVFTPLEYVMVDRITKRDEWGLWKIINGQINHVKRYKFDVPMIRIDGEGALSTDWFSSKLNEKGTTVDPTGAGELEAVAERKIQDVKKIFRAEVNTMPYSVGEVQQHWLVKYCASRINIRPTRNSVDYVSPREKLHARKIDVNKDLKHGFGDYVQVHNAVVNNTMEPRTSGALALMPSGNLEGSWYYFKLSNGEIVKRNRATVLPIPDNVIDYINARAVIKGKPLNRPKDFFERGRMRTVVEIDEDAEDPMDEEINIRLPREIVIHNDVHDNENEDDLDNDVQNHNDNEYATDIDAHNDLLEEEINDMIDEPPKQDNAELIYDIFGSDSDEEIVDHVIEEEIPDHVIEEEIPDPLPLRRSERNHQLGRWDRSVVGLTNISLTRAISNERKSNNYDDVRHQFMKRSFGLNMTVNQGIEKLGYQAILSVVTEVSQMVDKDVWSGVNMSDLTAEQTKRIITSNMFLKDKYRADGIFEKLKSRLIAGGHLQDREIYNNGASPTVSTGAILIVAAIAAKENRAVGSIDWPGAFLNSPMPQDGDHMVLMRLNKFLTSVLVEIDPSYKKFVNKNGTCVVRLNKALYGCVESARLWYDKLSGDLIKLGYVTNKADMCIFNRREADYSQTTLCLHVDDMKITCVNEIKLDQVINEIEKIYPGLSKQRGRVINYIGMTFDYRKNGQVKITMKKFIGDLLDDNCADIVGVAETPATNDLFTVRDISLSPLLLRGESERFHSITASLLYLSKRVRPDILTAVSFLTRRVMNPQKDDWTKLVRTIKYLRKTRAKGMILKPGEFISILAYIDASYGVHWDMKSHTGVVIGIGQGPVYAKSGTQKLNTKSSTEAELVGVSDSTGQVVWTRNFLLEQGYNMGPATIYQDNMSTIALIKNGRSNSERTRHIAIRFFFLADRVNSNEISIEYMPTGEMLADILTKPLQGELFRRLRDRLLNWYDADDDDE
jgi:hypothetical protein